jgi:hypothetical protein
MSPPKVPRRSPVDDILGREDASLLTSWTTC